MPFSLDHIHIVKMTNDPYLGSIFEHIFNSLTLYEYIFTLYNYIVSISRKRIEPAKFIHAHTHTHINPETQSQSQNPWELTTYKQYICCDHIIMYIRNKYSILFMQNHFLLIPPGLSRYQIFHHETHSLSRSISVTRPNGIRHTSI